MKKCQIHNDYIYIYIQMKPENILYKNSDSILYQQPMAHIYIYIFQMIYLCNIFKICDSEKRGHRSTPDSGSDPWNAEGGVRLTGKRFT